MRTSHVRLTGSYRKGILFFLLLMLAVVLIVLYFTLTKAIITITPHMREVQAEFFVDVADNNKNTNLMVPGTIQDKVIEKKETFKATGQKVIEPTVDGNNIGMVRVYNNLESKMELIRRTRLLSEDGTLVRLSKKITIDPLSSVEVSVYADDPDAFKELAIGKLTIPGLSAKNQESVYAENENTITTEKQEVTVITKEDVQEAVSMLSKKMIQEALNDIKITYGEDGPIALAMTGEVIESTFNQPVGAAAEEFTATVEMKIIHVFIEKNDIFGLIDERLRDSLQPGEEMVRLDFDKTQYAIEKYDLENNTAHVKVNALGYVKIGKDHPILNKEKIVNVNKKQLEIYLKSFDEVKDVDVEFTPFWVNKVPSMLDKIDIKIR